MELEVSKNSITIFLDTAPTEEQCDMLYRLSHNIDKFIELDKLIDEINILATKYFDGKVQYLTLEQEIQNSINGLFKEVEFFKEYNKAIENESTNT